MRRDALNSLTSIQILIHEFDQNDWNFQLQKNDQDQITHLFFSKDSSQELLKTNYEVLIMNCTYKINKYKMSLMIISDQTLMHINFYVIFCFMTQETTVDYCWILRQLKTLYDQFSDLTIFVIDMKRDLMHVIVVKFLNSHHLFCIWHINNNVTMNCKKAFNTKKEWTNFFNVWKKVMYVDSKHDFWELWRKFSLTYNNHEMMIEYLVITYITHARHFVKCFINRILHFETTMTSREKDEHAVLKRQLESSTRDLKIVVNEINLLLINEHHNYELVVVDQKVRYSTAFRKSIFSQLTAYITHYALRKIVTQYALLTD